MEYNEKFTKLLFNDLLRVNDWKIDNQLNVCISLRLKALRKTR